MGLPGGQNLSKPPPSFCPILITPNANMRQSCFVSSLCPVLLGIGQSPCRPLVAELHTWLRSTMPIVAYRGIAERPLGRTPPESSSPIRHAEHRQLPAVRATPKQGHVNAKRGEQGRCPTSAKASRRGFAPQPQRCRAVREPLVLQVLYIGTPLNSRIPISGDLVRIPI